MSSEWTCARCCGMTRDDVDAHIGQLADQSIDESAPEPGANARVRGLADHHVLHCQVARHGDDRVRDLALTLDEPALEQLRERLRLLGARFAFRILPPGDDEDCAEPAESMRQTACAADQRTAARAAAHRDEDVLRRGAYSTACAADGLGHEPERDLAQRCEVTGSEEVGERRVDLLGRVDVAMAHALAQRLGRDVDELDFVSIVENLVGEGLAHGNAGDVLGEILDRLEVLDVDGGDHVDAGGENLLDVLVPLGMAPPGDIGVRELVDQCNLRATGEHRVEVHLLHEPAVIFDLEPGQDLEAADRLLSQLAAMCLHEADDDVLALGAPVVRLAQHREGLAAAGRGAEEDAKTATSQLCACNHRRCRTSDGIAHITSSCALFKIAKPHPLRLDCWASSARSSWKTLITGSPNTQRMRPCSWDS